MSAPLDMNGIYIVIWKQQNCIFKALIIAMFWMSKLNNSNEKSVKRKDARRPD